MNSPPSKGGGFFGGGEKKSKKDKKHLKEEETSSKSIANPSQNPPNATPAAPVKLKKAKPSFKKLRVKKTKTKEEKEKEKGEKISSIMPTVSNKKPKKSSAGAPKDIRPEEKVPKRPVFGVPLKLACERNKSHDGVRLPAFYRQCIDYIEDFCLGYEGIYRVPGVVSKVNSIINDINFNRPLNISDLDPAVATSVVKNFLRQLPEPVLTDQLAPLFDDAASLQAGQIKSFKDLMSELPSENHVLLSWTVVHMSHVISRSRENKMSLENISIVLSPTLRISHRVLYVLFTHLHDLFGDLRLERYIPPLPAKDDIELPDTMSAIELELSKQNSLLESLHAELREGDEDKSKDNAIWEVQRVITLLKRKKNLLKLSDPEAIQNELRRQEDLLKSLHEKMQTVDKSGSGEGNVTDAGNELWEVISIITLLKRKLKTSKKSFLQKNSTTSPPTLAAPAATNTSIDEFNEVLNFTLRKADSESIDETASIAAGPGGEVTTNNEVGLPSPFAAPSSTVAVESKEINLDEVMQKRLSSHETSPQHQQPTSSTPVDTSPETQPSKETESLFRLSSSRLHGNSSSPSGKSFYNSYPSLNEPNPYAEPSNMDDIIQRGLMPAGEFDYLLANDDEKYMELIRYKLMEEELLAIKSDLNARISAEEREINLLYKNIETMGMKSSLGCADSFDAVSDSDSSDSSLEEENIDNLICELKDLQAYNERLAKENSELCEKIEMGRNRCVDLKIMLRTQMSLGCL